jgi:hypothetical protein
MESDKGWLTAREILAEMEGQPMDKVAERLATEMDDAGVEVDMISHLQAMVAALLQTLGYVARDVGAILKASGMNVDPDEYAGRLQGIALLTAQVTVYDKFMGGYVVEVVDAPIPDGEPRPALTIVEDPRSVDPASLQ